ncbi:hypothetical protein EDD16DRAFT_1521042 [Pisolithus croceorrhizus]|nr:hypothetical protein EDD16DRAFT_1521042 [Pisolithus croceorrhizus]KAI6146600.1 hypothetical protein EDD17DRAFT_1788887 [Pisolithus thermaeus]
METGNPCALRQATGFFLITRVLLGFWRASYAYLGTIVSLSLRIIIEVIWAYLNLVVVLDLVVLLASSQRRSGRSWATKAAKPVIWRACLYRTPNGMNRQPEISGTKPLGQAEKHTLTQSYSYTRFHSTTKRLYKTPATPHPFQLRHDHHSVHTISARELMVNSITHQDINIQVYRLREVLIPLPHHR